jgi:hypothetical protein
LIKGSLHFWLDNVFNPPTLLADSGLFKLFNNFLGSAEMDFYALKNKKRSKFLLVLGFELDRSLGILKLKDK